MTTVKLAVITVPPEDAVLCQADGCNRTIHRKINILRHEGVIRLFGSECAKKLVGQRETFKKTKAVKFEQYEWLLNPRDIELLRANTEQLLQDLQQRFHEEGHSGQSASEVTGPGRIFQKDDFSTWSDDRLMQFCMNQARAEFREERHLDPDLPGWKGMVKMSAERLFDQYRGKD